MDNRLNTRLEAWDLLTTIQKDIRNVLPPQKMLRLMEVNEGIEIAFKLKRMSETPLVK